MATEIEITHNGKYVNGLKEYLDDPDNYSRGDVLVITSGDKVVGKVHFTSTSLEVLEGDVEIEYKDDESDTMVITVDEDDIQVSKLLRDWK